MNRPEKTLLRFVTTGSVDDGKSTLIGRLLYESNAILEDQYAAVKRASKRRGRDAPDLSLLLDGLAAEREQGITIDVAYRYFETPKRKFIIADTPGHVQYTRNTVTGASNAQLALILIDARKGVLTQSRRHGMLISILQIPHLIVAINKMDLVDYSEDVFRRIVAEYEEFSDKLDVHDIEFIPVSALQGDNIASKTDKMPWYDGPTLLHRLENVHVAADRNLVDFRFPVQDVLRPNQNFRGYAGSVASGTIRRGDEVVVLPTGAETRIRSIVTFDGEMEEAFAPLPVVLTLEDEIDVSRGDMIVRRRNLPLVSDRLEATICWMDSTPSSVQESYILKHTTRQVKARFTDVLYRINVDTLHRESVDRLQLNDIGRADLMTANSVFFDSYQRNRGTGSFILIDPHTSNTVAAGMIRGMPRTIDDLPSPEREKGSDSPRSSNVVWSGWNIARESRERRNGHRAAVVWFTGFSGSGKSTIARDLEHALFAKGCQTVLLDGDGVRHGLCGDLGFSVADRSENIRRVGETARLFFESGHIVLCAFISPLQRDRSFARSLISEGRFIEVFTRCSLEVCKERDPKGLYRRAERGEIKDFTGVSSPYEIPKDPELVAQTDAEDVESIVQKVISELRDRTILSG